MEQRKKSHLHPKKKKRNNQILSQDLPWGRQKLHPLCRPLANTMRVSGNGEEIGLYVIRQGQEEGPTTQTGGQQSSQ
eukprot:8218523-Prorocentrum_lima.AAC.1